MSEQEMRRAVLDLVLWVDPDRLKPIWSFIHSYLSDEIVGIHADEDYLILHGEFLKERKEAQA